MDINIALNDTVVIEPVPAILSSEVVSNFAPIDCSNEDSATTGLSAPVYRKASANIERIEDSIKHLPEEVAEGVRASVATLRAMFGI